MLRPHQNAPYQLENGDTLNVAYALKRRARSDSMTRRKRETNRAAMNYLGKFVRFESTDDNGMPEIAFWDFTVVGKNSYGFPPWEYRGKGQYGEFNWQAKDFTKWDWVEFLVEVLTDDQFYQVWGFGLAAPRRTMAARR